MSANENGVLHLYAQYTEHDEGRIAGTKAGLEALLRAVKHAIDHGDSESTAWVNDGEGYLLRIECVPDPDEIEVPYTQGIVEQSIAQWKERAFEAEAKAYRMKNGLPEPVAAIQS